MPVHDWTRVDAGVFHHFHLMWIAELARVPVGGTEQTVMIRAASPDRPVILWLAGGPGQSDLALARAQVSGWEQDFVFAALDQRGNGTSYSAIDPASSLTLDTAVSDVIEVTDYLRARFDEPKIYLMGESWGTLGVLAVQRRPDLYYAWIGSGQMVDVLWKNGQQEAAIRLEVLWNHLANSQAFSLMCGYAIGHFYKDASFDHICGQHTHVLSADGKPVAVA